MPPTALRRASFGRRPCEPGASPNGSRERHCCANGSGIAELEVTLSRRALLGAALAAGVVPAAAPASRHDRMRLVAETRTLEVNGRAARVFGLVGADGHPGLRLAPGERFRVDLANRSGVR